jgi:hypothetical protein
MRYPCTASKKCTPFSPIQSLYAIHGRCATAGRRHCPCGWQTVTRLPVHGSLRRTGKGERCAIAVEMTILVVAKGENA